MDFTLPETGTDVANLAADIAARISTDERVATLESQRSPIDADLWRELGSSGLLGLELPAALVGDNGADLTPVETVSVAKELGRRLARVPYAIHAIAAAPVIAAHGSDALRSDILSAAATGAIVLSVALDEDPGTDLDTPAAQLSGSGSGSGSGDRYILSGTKVNVPYAAAAHRLLVSAVGPSGAAVVVLDPTTEGVLITESPSTGLIPSYRVECDGVSVAGDNVLASAALTDLVNRSILAICADQAGVCAQALAATAEYAREREQFGKPIGSFQAVAQRLADGYIDCQGLELTTQQAAWALAEQGVEGAEPPATAIRTAKFWAAETGHRVAHSAVHIHGGVGLDVTHPVHRYYLRAKQNEFSLGSAPMTLRSIGAALADSPA